MEINEHSSCHLKVGLSSNGAGEHYGTLPKVLSNKKDGIIIPLTFSYGMSGDRSCLWHMHHLSLGVRNCVLHWLDGGSSVQIHITHTDTHTVAFCAKVGGLTES
mgnify:CR=1 FL=1